MPLFHDGANDPFGLPVGTGSLDTGESLFYPIFGAFFHEGVPAGIALVLGSVVRVVHLYGVRALIDYLFKELSSRMLCLVRQYRGKQLTGEVVNRHEQIFPLVSRFLAFQDRQPFRVAVQHLARIVFIVALRLALQSLFDAFLYLGQTA